MNKINKKQLETLAQEFYKTKLWELLSDSDIFAVELEDGRIVYCCIMGNAGEHIGLGIYIGTRGFRTYLDTVTLDVSKDHKLGFERIANFNCVQLAFNENGNADFYVHRTHKVPEPDNCTPEDFEVLQQALVATISLAKFIKIAGDDVVAIGFDEYEEYPSKEGDKEAILMKHEGNGYICNTINCLPTIPVKKKSWKRWQPKPQKPLSTCQPSTQQKTYENRHSAMSLDTLSNTIKG